MSNCPFSLWLSTNRETDFATACAKATVGSAAARSREQDAPIGRNFTLLVDFAAIFIDGTWSNFIGIFIQWIEANF